MVRESTMTGRTGYSSDYFTDASKAASVDLDSAHRSHTLWRPIPPPSVAVRSEFPTVSRSNEQQPFTCLVTVEVPANGWTLDERDLHLPLSSRDVPTVEEETEPENRSRSQPEVPPLSHSPQSQLDQVASELTTRVMNWHNLDWRKFGRLRRCGVIGVSKDKNVWQVLECHLYEQMLICVRERPSDGPSSQHRPGRCKLKGSILMRKHLQAVETFADESILHLRLSAPDVPSFYLLFNSQSDVQDWKNEIVDLIHPDVIEAPSQHFLEPLIDEYAEDEPQQETQYANEGSAGVSESAATVQTGSARLSPHVPVDIVAVVSLCNSMHGIKLSNLQDTLRFARAHLGPHDRLSIVSFGTTSGPTIICELHGSDWLHWEEKIAALEPSPARTSHGDMVEGVNTAIDMLMSRTYGNPLASVMLISDSDLIEPDDVDYIVTRAEARGIGVYSFGYGMTHRPETLIELSTRTRATYTFVKDWMGLRECVAGCLGMLQMTSHQGVKVRLTLPDGSPAKFVKVSGALHSTKRASGKDAEAVLGDLRFGERRDILVQLNVVSEGNEDEARKHLRTSLEALGGAAMMSGETGHGAYEEVPLLQADVTYADILRDGHATRVPRPSLLTVTLMPPEETASDGQAASGSTIPPNPAIIQRRMELLTSDMLSRALKLAGRGQVENAQTLLSQTRSILSGLSRSNAFPPAPMTPRHLPLRSISRQSGRDVRSSVATADTSHSGSSDSRSIASSIHHLRRSETPSSSPTVSVSVDSVVLDALDADLAAALDWIAHPVVFSRDARKAALQAIGVIASQRAFTLRTASERLFAMRMSSVRQLLEASETWRTDADARRED
ncbi:hypothetical protein KEM52_004469 [Ascosphaera acerosa]|nr:hypothetical protein KEM52_004469 [Ascosphaera acerosa]